MTLKRHFTRHGTQRGGDSLDVLHEEAQVLREALAQWRALQAPGDAPQGPGDAPQGPAAVEQNWDAGTLGKVVLEHAAVWLAAARDVARALGTGTAGEGLGGQAERARPFLDRLEVLGRGTEPVSAAANEDFRHAVDEVGTALAQPLSDPELAPKLARELGERRHRLRTARYVRKHAPVHPGPRRWYDTVGPIVRLETAWDRARGFPWPESAPMASRTVAEQFDKEG